MTRPRPTRYNREGRGGPTPEEREMEDLYTDQANPIIGDAEGASETVPSSADTTKIKLTFYLNLDNGWYEGTKDDEEILDAMCDEIAAKVKASLLNYARLEAEVEDDEILVSCERETIVGTSASYIEWDAEGHWITPYTRRLIEESCDSYLEDRL